LFIYKVAAAVAGVLEVDYSNEILITQSELEEKNRLEWSLQQQVEETRTESEYQMRLRENQYSEDKTNINKQFNMQLSELRQSVHK
jgi:hypothetical protein